MKSCEKLNNPSLSHMAHIKFQHMMYTIIKRQLSTIKDDSLVSSNFARATNDPLILLHTCESPMTSCRPGDKELLQLFPSKRMTNDTNVSSSRSAYHFGLVPLSESAIDEKIVSKRNFSTRDRLSA